MSDIITIAFEREFLEDFIEVLNTNTVRSSGYIWKFFISENAPGKASLGVTKTVDTKE